MYTFWPLSSRSAVKSLWGGTTTVITTLFSEKTSYSWLASAIWVFEAYSEKFGVNQLFHHLGTLITMSEK